MAESETTSFFTHSLYDKLKYIAQIILPAIGTLVLAVGGIWNWGYTVQTAGTITALDLFLGAILKLSSNAYYRNEANFDGDVNLSHDPTTGENKIQIAAYKPLEDIADEPGKHSIELRVNRLDEPRS